MLVNKSSIEVVITKGMLRLNSFFSNAMSLFLTLGLGTLSASMAVVEDGAILRVLL
jgi:hypothetical protein